MDFQHFAEHRLQEIALLIMAIVYTLRLRWLLKFKPGKERQPETGLPGTTMKKGILYSWANILMPWAMESTRAKFFIYLQFAFFHIIVFDSLCSRDSGDPICDHRISNFHRSGMRYRNTEDNPPGQQ